MLVVRIGRERNFIVWIAVAVSVLGFESFQHRLELIRRFWYAHADIFQPFAVHIGCIVDTGIPCYIRNRIDMSVWRRHLLPHAGQIKNRLKYWGRIP